jgi:hypothetical protein
MQPNDYWGVLGDPPIVGLSVRIANWFQVSGFRRDLMLWQYTLKPET